MINNYFEREYRPHAQVYAHESGNKLYIGDVTAALDKEFINNKNITLGTCATMQVVTAALGMEHVAYELPIQHIVYPLLDKQSEDMSRHFGSFYELAERQLRSRNILVHCFAGISRSATLVISYLMKKNKWAFKDAIAFVRRSKPNVLPNLGFERQLKEYEKVLKSENNEVRKIISKTSEARKHSKDNKRREGLPEIASFGKTLVKSKIIDASIIPGSQLQQRKTKLLPFLEMQERKVAPIEQIGIKSYHRRSTTQPRNNIAVAEKLSKLVQNRKKALEKFSPPEFKFNTEKVVRRKVGF